MSEDTQRADAVRAAELIGSLCLATDLGMGFPFEHGLRTTVVAARLAATLAVDPETASQTFYASLLSHSGCTTDAHVTAEIFGGSLTTHLHPAMNASRREVFTGILRALPAPETKGPARIIQIARRLPKAAREQRPHFAAMCEVAEMLAEGVGLPSSLQHLFDHLTERWDGKGPLSRAEGDAIPLPIRIVHVAADATLHRLLGDDEHVARAVRDRAGHGLDPDIAACLAAGAEEILAIQEEASVWDEALACEPQPHLTLEDEAIERALSSMGNFADLLSPYLTGHSTGVSDLAAEAARRCRLDPDEITEIKRAALVHDLGRVAVGAGTWQKPGPLSTDEWEHVRLHPYHTERILSRSRFLEAVAPVARAHHERLDRSGYHRGAAGAELTTPARLLAAADVYHALTERRPHRPAFAAEEAARILTDEARAERLDTDAVTAVIEAAGLPAPRLDRPAGLTEREAEVVGLLARGLQTKQVARALGISVKTADRHIQNAYGKIGVSTRAAATLFAMEHGLIARGELPIARAQARSQRV
jgi:HD-GYP domain-containing protein (c-di-GMP phosphodiesterase class II)